MVKKHHANAPVPDEVLDAVDKIIDAELAKEDVRPEDFFDAAVAEEMKKIEPDKPPRMTAPFNLAQAISAGAMIPEGSAVQYPEVQHFQFLANGGEDVDYLFTIGITARNPAGLRAAVDVMIRAGQGNFRHDGVEILLYAVSGFKAVSRVPGRDAYTTNLNYIFRVRPIEAGPEARR